MKLCMFIMAFLIVAIILNIHDVINPSYYKGLRVIK